MDPRSILEAIRNELLERYENVRCELWDNPTADVFFSHTVQGFDAWRHALVIVVTPDTIEATPGPLFQRNWKYGGKRTFELCDPSSIDNLLKIIEECGNGRPKIREVEKRTA